MYTLKKSISGLSKSPISFTKTGKEAPTTGIIKCVNCKNEVSVSSGKIVPHCPVCKDISMFYYTKKT